MATMVNFIPVKHQCVSMVTVEVISKHYCASVTYSQSCLHHFSLLGLLFSNSKYHITLVYLFFFKMLLFFVDKSAFVFP